MTIEDILQALPSKEDIGSAICLEARHSTTGDTLAAFGIFATGIAVGAGLALLFAPKAGHKMRADIAEKIGELGEQMGVVAPPPATSTNRPGV